MRDPSFLVAAAVLAVTGVVHDRVEAQTVYPTGTTIWAQDETDNGRTLFTAPTGEGILVDRLGNVVHRWQSPVAGDMLALVEPLPSGNILCGTSPPGQQIQTVLELDSAGAVVWSFTLSPAVGYVHHDLERLPNGNTLLLCAQTITVPDISPVPLLDDFLLEVAPDGSVVWSWYTYQHYTEFGFDAQASRLIAAQGGDWAHTNAADPLPPNGHTDPRFRAGNLVVSQRFTNVVYIIDRATGKVVWQVGPSNNLSFGQHAPYMIPQDYPGAGHLLLFDNGAGTGYPVPGRSPGFSKVLEIDVTNSMVTWFYSASQSGLFNRLFYSDIVSNARRLKNGNTLICSGVRGRLFEVNPAGRIVWEYMSPFLGTASGPLSPLVYRAWRVDAGWPVNVVAE